MKLRPWHAITALTHRLIPNIDNETADRAARQIDPNGPEVEFTPTSIRQASSHPDTDDPDEITPGPLHISIGIGKCRRLNSINA